MRVLTGKELKFAAKNGIPVFYEERYYNPDDKHLEVLGKTILKKANVGFYIGNSDIEPDLYGDDEYVNGEFNKGYFGVYAIPDVKYE